jgi:AcrR family transcriptional regulator
MGIPERKEREKEHRREEILSAAQAVFFEKGLQNSTMDEIAESAELSKGTLYLYYKSKEDLYLSVMVRGMGILREMFGEAVALASNPIDALQRIGDTYYRFFLEHRSYYRMFHFFEHPQVHKQVSADIRTSCTTENHRIWDLIISVIQKGTDEDLIRVDLLPPELAVLLWSSANAIMMRIEDEQGFWKTRLNIELEHVLFKSNALLLEAIMTDKAKREFPLAVSSVHP